MLNGIFTIHSSMLKPILLITSLFCICCNLKDKQETTKFLDNDQPDSLLLIDTVSRSKDENPSIGSKDDSISMVVGKKANLLEKYIASDDKTSRVYFDAFPNTFRQLVIIFGYYGEVDEFGLHEQSGILAENSQDYIETFFKNTEVDKSEFTKRLIDLAQESEWQADGVSIFQDNVKRFTEQNLNLVVTELRERKDHEIVDFWTFCFDGNHTENNRNEFKALQLRVLPIDKRIGDFLGRAFKDLEQKSIQEH
jgi:hypothetical protein